MSEGQPLVRLGLRIVGRRRPFLTDANADLETFAAHPAVAGLADWRISLRSDFSSLATALERVAKPQSGALLKTVRTRDLPAEAREREKSGQDGPARSLVSYEVDVVSPFAEMFANNFDPLKHWSIWVRWFARSAELLPDDAAIAAAGTETIEKTNREVIGFAKDALALRARMENLPSVFDRDLWKKIAKWVNRELSLGGETGGRDSSLVREYGWRRPPWHSQKSQRFQGSMG